MGFPRQKYWSGLPFPSAGDLPDPGIEPESPALQADSLPLSHWEVLVVFLRDGYFHLSTWLSCEVKSLSRFRLFATPWTVAYQAPPTMGFFRQEYWSGLPFPSPG